MTRKLVKSRLNLADLSRPFQNNLFLFFLLFNLRWAQLYVSLVSVCVCVYVMGHACESSVFRLGVTTTAIIFHWNLHQLHPSSALECNCLYSPSMCGFCLYNSNIRSRSISVFSTGRLVALKHVRVRVLRPSRPPSLSWLITLLTWICNNKTSDWWCTV